MSETSAGILEILRTGSRSAVELCQRLNISQPTLSRRIAAVGDEIIRFGPQRGIRYARRRSIRHWNQFALSRITREGQIEHWGTLYPVMPEGYVLAFSLQDRANERYDGLPWWMQDMRPQGFIGRNFAKSMAARLELPFDLETWSDDQVLLALTESDADIAGNLLLGEQARQRWLSAPPPLAIAEHDVPGRFRYLAQQALSGEATGSSAGGDQPKFTAYVSGPDGAGYHALVKFTAPEDNATSQRWRNLLACEQIALAFLHESGLPAAATRIIDTQGQRFLEVMRFDRDGEFGRRGVVSLLVLDAEFVGYGAEWPQITRKLHSDSHILLEAHDIACRYYAFGLLIGNGDMHPGNLSFLHDGTRPLSVAPVYDMLPMSLSPRASGVIPEAARLAPIVLARFVEASIWREILPLAEQYWLRVISSPLIDARFGEQAHAMRQRLGEVRTQLARLV